MGSAGRRAVGVAFASFILVFGVEPAAASQVTRSEDVTVLGLNALIGGFTSGAGALVTGKPVLRAIGQGLVGGGVIYTGKRLASTPEVRLAGLTGRMVAATGTSMVRNGAAGRGLVEMLVVPVGPFTVYRRPAGEETHAPVKLNLARTLLLVGLVMREDIHVDWRETLSSGAPVFHTPGRPVRSGYGWMTAGAVLFATVILSDMDALPAYVDYDRLVAHERVHVLQDDFLDAGLAGPIETWLLGFLPGLRWVRRFVDIGALHAGLFGLGLYVLPYDERPWEMEAKYFERRLASAPAEEGGRPAADRILPGDASPGR